MFLIYNNIIKGLLNINSVGKHAYSNIKMSNSPQACHRE